MKIKEKLLPLLTVFFVAAFAVIPCFHPPVTAQAATLRSETLSLLGGGDGSRVVDNADLLTDSEEADLKEQLDEICTRQSFDIVILTENGLGGKTEEAYADDFYDYNGYGFGDSHDGCLLLVDMDSRICHTSTTGFGATALTDYGLEQLDDVFVPYLSQGKYYEAFSRYADAVDELVTRAKEGSPLDVNTASQQEDIADAVQDKSAPGPAAAAGGVGIGAAAAAISTGRMKSKLKSVRTQHGASQYYKRNSMHINVAREDFLYRHVTRTEIPRERNGGGGSTMHVGSSGISHGGHSSHF